MMRQGLTIKGLLQLTNALALMALVALCWGNQSQIASTHQDFMEEERIANAIFSIKEARYSVVQIQQFLTDVGATRSREAEAEAASSLKAAERHLDELAQSLPSMENEIRALQKQVDTMYAVGLEMADAYVFHGTDVGNEMMKGAGGFDDSSEGLIDALEALSDSLDNQFQRAKQHTLASTKSASVTILLASLVLGITFSGLIYLVYRRIIKPLTELQDSMEEIAAGDKDVTVRLDDTGNDEIAMVATHFNQFVGNIQSLIAEVSHNTHELAATQTQLHGGSIQTLEGMQKLQAETTQVATAMTQMQATAIGVAENAESAAQAAEQSNQHAIEGNKVVAQTAASISHLAHDVEQAANMITKLEGNAESVGGILEVIRGIADQTNLLALNAAIEAARAGEQGRGFAVVADEVRTLAQRTQDSTDQIQQMIIELQSGAKDAVLAMQQGQEQARISTAHATEASEALDQITNSVDTITNMAAQIAAAADQQTAVIEDINLNILNISNEAKVTTENAQQSSASSHQVGALSEHLKVLSGQYKTT